jgi:ribosomal protein S12 methylthiotransferase
VRLGVREVNLVAQDPASYGQDLGDGTDLLALLRALDGVEEVAWFRLLYMFPFGLDERHLEVLAGSKRFCAYLDMPLQHSHREVLQAMRRPGDGARYLAHLKTIRERWPGVTLRTTFLVGHPGETEAHFQDLCRFVEQARVQWAGVFEYSLEEGTHSATLEQSVARRTAARRAKRLRELAEEARDLTPFRLGQVRQALVVEQGDGFVACRTASEAPEVDGCVLTPPHAVARAGQFVQVRVEQADGFDFTGEIVGSGETASVSPEARRGRAEVRRRRERGPVRAAA